MRREEGEEEGSGEERVEVEGEKGEPGAHKTVCKGEAGGVRLQDGM